MAVARTVELSAEVERQLALAIPRLVAEFDPVRIYLYGSQARGEATEDSDIDLLLVMPDEFRASVQTHYRVSRLLGYEASKVSVGFWAAGSFETRLGRKASLPSTVVREGSLLYG